MHNAPSVHYPVGRSFLAGGFLLVIWLAGAVFAGLWMAQSAGPGWRHGTGWLVWGAVGAAALWQWCSAPHGELEWDGHEWSWNRLPGPVSVHLDFQFFMLVHWRGARAGKWLCLERSRAPAQWLALRRAVYSRATPDALQRPEPAAKT